MSSTSIDAMDRLFDRFCDEDGVLRTNGLTSLLLQGGLDEELSSLILKRAQFLTDQKGSVSLTREDFDDLLDNSASARIPTGERHGVKRFEPVRIMLGGPPSQGSALINAARLGIELENDVRIASERLKQMRVPGIPPYQPVVRIIEPEPRVPVSSNEPSADIKKMPLL